MSTAFWLENNPEGSIRDFILTALGIGQEVFSSEQGFAAADDASEIEGSWRLLSTEEALSSIPTDSDGQQWDMRRDDSGNPYFIFGGNFRWWLWYIPASREWLTDADGNTCDPSRYINVGPGADFIEEQARHFASL